MNDRQTPGFSDSVIGAMPNFCVLCGEIFFWLDVLQSNKIELVID
jgi:hypothetical protein